jgi:glycosyltransferase involved in cell wall biosynthesis
MADSDIALTYAWEGRLPAAGSCDLTVVILTYNEDRHLARAIESVRGIARSVLVVDSFSTDRTLSIAQAVGARVIQHPFVNQARQFNWALDQGGIDTAWIMRLDADEVIESDLANEIATSLPAMSADVAGITFSRKHVFMGRWIRHGGRYPLVMLRLWRTGRGRIEDRWMDEHVVVDGGRTVAMRGGFADICLNDLSFFIDKHNRYASREAIEQLSRRYGLAPSDRGLSMTRLSRQARIKRWTKERIYNRLPFWIGPSSYFLYRYIFQLGFLDGKEGLIYHLLQGFWYRFLVNAKVVEFEAAMANCLTADDRLKRLSELTGHDLTRR